MQDEFESPAQALISRNMQQWAALATAALRFCKLCDWPLDEWVSAYGNIQDERCSVCVHMETLLARSSYWLRVQKDELAHRRNMGLD